MFFYRPQFEVDYEGAFESLEESGLQHKCNTYRTLCDLLQMRIDDVLTLVQVAFVVLVLVVYFLVASISEIKDEVWLHAGVAFLFYSLLYRFVLLKTLEVAAKISWKIPPKMFVEDEEFLRIVSEKDWRIHYLLFGSTIHSQKSKYWKWQQFALPKSFFTMVCHYLLELVAALFFIAACLSLLGLETSSDYLGVCILFLFAFFALYFVYANSAVQIEKDRAFSFYLELIKGLDKSANKNAIEGGRILTFISRALKANNMQSAKTYAAILIKTIFEDELEQYRIDSLLEEHVRPKLQKYFGLTSKQCEELFCYPTN